jgi:hypothetical protein
MPSPLRGRNASRDVKNLRMPVDSRHVAVDDEASEREAEVLVHVVLLLHHLPVASTGRQRHHPPMAVGLAHPPRSRQRPEQPRPSPARACRRHCARRCCRRRQRPTARQRGRRAQRSAEAPGLVDLPPEPLRQAQREPVLGRLRRRGVLSHSFCGRSSWPVHHVDDNDRVGGEVSGQDVAGGGDGRVGEIGAADGAGDVRREPRVDARGVEHVAAPGEEAELLAGGVERGEADRALERPAAGPHRPRRRVREHRQRLHRRGVEPRARGGAGAGGQGTDTAPSPAAARVGSGAAAAAEEGREEAEQEERDDQADEEERGGDGKPTADAVHGWRRRWRECAGDGGAGRRLEELRRGGADNGERERECQRRAEDRVVAARPRAGRRRGCHGRE